MNILVVEDESIVAKDIQVCLRKLGYEVISTCSSGEDAIDKALEMKPDLIMMDIMLKGDMSGIDAAEVFPCRSIVTITLSILISNFLAVASRILIFAW